MMPQDRRTAVRKPLDRLTYLSLPFDNGGIVLDVSEGGLGFHSISPLKSDGPIEIRFSIGSATRIAAVGELAWKDETGKTGGLRFTHLPDEARERIRFWAGQSKTSAKTSSITSPSPEINAIADAIAGAVAYAQARADESRSNILVAEPPIEMELAPVSEASLAPGVEVPAAKFENRFELAPSRKFDPMSAAAARHHPRLYNLNPPVYSAPFNGLSMFPLDLKPEASASSFTLPKFDIATHPIAAVVLTIVLAFLVTMGIVAYMSMSGAGELLLEWGDEMRSGSYSQSIPQSALPPAISVQYPDATERPTP
jgi:hypothetical protein